MSKSSVHSAHCADLMARTVVSKRVEITQLTELCVGSVVMLLKNFIIEHKLASGAMGVVLDVIHPTEKGPDNDAIHCPLPACFLVDFKQHNLPVHDGLSDQLPQTCVPVHIVMNRFEKKCCQMTTVPLCTHKDVTMHKSQGMTVGPDHLWERLLVKSPRENSRFKVTCVESLAFSAVTDLQGLAIDDCDGVPNTVMNIVTKLEHTLLQAKTCLSPGTSATFTPICCIHEG